MSEISEAGVTLLAALTGAQPRFARRKKAPRTYSGTLVSYIFGTYVFWIDGVDAFTFTCYLDNGENIARFESMNVRIEPPRDPNPARFVAVL